MAGGSLADRVVIVTGATSGIGAATARRLARESVRVVLGARRQDRLDLLAAELGSDMAVPVRMDVRSPTAAQLLVDASLARFGRIDGLVASAGVGAYGSVLDHSDDTIAAMIDTNVSGTVWPVRAVVPHLLVGGGDIVIIGSVAGLRGGAHEAVYAATKSAQLGFAGALDRELAPKGVRVTAICPAATNTEFAMGYGRSPEMPELAEWLTPDDVAETVVTVLRQPRHMRTSLWSMWSMAEVG